MKNLKIKIWWEWRNFYFSVNNKINPFFKYITYKESLYIKEIFNSDLYNLEYFYSDNYELADKKSLELWKQKTTNNILVKFPLNKKMYSMLNSVMCCFYFTFDNYQSEIIGRDDDNTYIYGDEKFVGCYTQTTLPNTSVLVGWKYKTIKRV